MDSLAINNTDGISIHAGFPNAGSDAALQSLDLHRRLVPRPISSFLFRLRGNDWTSYGIFDGDLVIVDRAMEPRPRDLTLWWQASSGEFVLGRRQTMPPEAAVWGCVTSIIHELRQY